MHHTQLVLAISCKGQVGGRADARRMLIPLYLCIDISIYIYRYDVNSVCDYTFMHHADVAEEKTLHQWNETREY